MKLIMELLLLRGMLKLGGMMFEMLGGMMFLLLGLEMLGGVMLLVLVAFVVFCGPLGLGPHKGI